MILTLLFVARVVLGFIFLLAGSGKLLSSNTLEDAIHQYQILPKYVVRAAARFLPFIECISGTFILLGVILPLVSGVLMLMLVIFTIAIGINLRRGRIFSCHCFGNSASTIGPAMVVRNILLIGIACFVLSQSIGMLGIQATFSQWQFYLRQLIQLDILIPTIASIALVLGCIFLISEIDPILQRRIKTQ